MPWMRSRPSQRPHCTWTKGRVNWHLPALQACVTRKTSRTCNRMNKQVWMEQRVPVCVGWCQHSGDTRGP